MPLESQTPTTHIGQDSPGLTLLRRAESWQPRPLGLGDTLRLESVGLEIPVAELYEGVDFSIDRQWHPPWLGRLAVLAPICGTFAGTRDPLDECMNRPESSRMGPSRHAASTSL